MLDDAAIPEEWVYDAPPDGFDLHDDDAGFEPPDALDAVIEVADMMSVFAAQRFVRVAAMRRDALAAAPRGGRLMMDVVERGIRLELAAALRITEYAAGMLLGIAEAVVHRYPAVLDSLGRAGMTERHAEILVTGVDSVEPEFRDAVLAQGMELAESQPVGTFRRALQKLIEAVRYATLEERYQEALKLRRVTVEPLADGMALVSATIPVVEAQAIHGRLTAMAKVIGAQEGEARSLDELRADIFGDLLVEGNVAAHPKKARGIRATVFVTVPVLALLEGAAGGPARDHGGRGERSAGIGAGALGAIAAGELPSVEGVGPIPLSVALRLSGGADGWTRVLTHPETGMVLSVGRRKYKTPAALARLVRWRADRCMAPGCGMPASRCHVDHSIAFSQGGATALTNLGPMCVGHHIVKHHGGWTVIQVDGSGGALLWISPTGRRYVVTPERRVPVFRPEDPLAPF